MQQTTRPAAAIVGLGIAGIGLFGAIVGIGRWRLEIFMAVVGLASCGYQLMQHRRGC